MEEERRDNSQSGCDWGREFDLQSTQPEPLLVRPHHLLCAVCVRGGCETPPCGKQALQELLDRVWENPYMPLRIVPDLEVTHPHYRDVFEQRGAAPLPDRFEQRFADHVARRRDLEVCRRLHIAQEAVIPAMWVYRMLFSRVPTVADICGEAAPPSDEWPSCPHAQAGFYEKIAAGEEPENPDPDQPEKSTREWGMMRARSRSEMDRVKAEAARSIAEADHLYIRAQHLMCILCAHHHEEPIVADMLVELRYRMEQEPDIPVTITEGCCMVCDNCAVYDPAQNICYSFQIENQLRDLGILRRLGLVPGATLPAGELYQLVYDRIESVADTCTSGDDPKPAPFWPNCSSAQKPHYEQARQKGVITGNPRKD